ncbi:MAG: guanylate kinase [Oscillospiraceae bacterium]
MTTNDKGLIFIVSGPSGCGKSTVLHEVFKKRDKLYFSVSATTREPRLGERDGIEYFFLTHEKFKEMLAHDEFLEHAEYAGNSYGTPRGPVEEKLGEGYDVVMDIEVKGAKQVKDKRPDAVSVFIKPPSLEVLEMRLRGRSTETEEKILERLETAKIEIEAAKCYDYIVVNDEVDRAAAELLDIMESSKAQARA